MSPKLIRLFEAYADSHRHPTNRLTHKIAIPLIVFHTLAMLDWIPLAGPITAGHLGAALALAWYFAMSPKLAVFLALYFAACFPVARLMPVPAVVAIAIFAWIVQLAGHYVWEKKSPAFLSNVVQTLVGPIFFVAIYTGEWPLRRSAH